MEIDLNLKFMNKAKASNNMHPFSTRIEFRYKRLSKDLADNEIYLKKTIDKVNEMDGKLLQLEENMSKQTYKVISNR